MLAVLIFPGGPLNFIGYWTIGIFIMIIILVGHKREGMRVYKYSPGEK